MTKSNKYALSKISNKNPMWKGDEVKYKGLHSWIKRHKPKPEFCEDCKIQKPKDLANISQKYKRDTNDFEWICRRCHMEKDGRMKKLYLIRPQILLKYIPCITCKKPTKPRNNGHGRVKYCSRKCYFIKRFGEHI